MTTPRYAVFPHEWDRYAVWDNREKRRVSIHYNADAARHIADMMSTEHLETIYREAGHGEEVAPRPVVIDSANIKPLDDTPPPPEEWSYTGVPSLIIIDAANPDHWRRYVWSYVADNAANRAEATQDRVQSTMMGYELGYYPIDPSDWQMIPDGPYCAACIDPINGYETPTPARPEEYPQAFHAEIIDSPDEDNDGNPIPRYCAGCGEPLYTPDN